MCAMPSFDMPRLSRFCLSIRRAAHETHGVIIGAGSWVDKRTTSGDIPAFRTQGLRQPGHPARAAIRPSRLECVRSDLHGRDSVLATAVGRDFKGKVSVAVYVVAIPLAFVSAWVAFTAYALVAILWLVPDRRIEKTLAR